MKYFYGTIFALSAGLLALLVLSIYVPMIVALSTSAVITALCILPGAKLMEGETLRESLLGKDE
jgi:hypothetical protein